MDFFKNLLNVFRRKHRRYPSTVLNTGIYGNWHIKVNPGWGIVVTNIGSNDEFHFCEKSNGWITTLRKGNPKEHFYYVLTPAGENAKIPMGIPFFADEETIKKHKYDTIMKAKEMLAAVHEKKG